MRGTWNSDSNTRPLAMAAWGKELGWSIFETDNLHYTKLSIQILKPVAYLTT